MKIDRFLNLLMVLITLMICSCTQESHQIVLSQTVHFKSAKTSPLKIYLGQYITKTMYVKGDTLIIRPDSSFELNTCGNIIQGKALVEHDGFSLLCYRNEVKWSHKIFAKDVPYDTLIYKQQQNGEVIRSSHFTKGKFKGFESLEILEQFHPN